MIDHLARCGSKRERRFKSQTQLSVLASITPLCLICGNFGCAVSINSCTATAFSYNFSDFTTGSRRTKSASYCACSWSSVQIIARPAASTCTAFHSAPARRIFWSRSPEAVPPAVRHIWRLFTSSCVDLFVPYYPLAYFLCQHPLHDSEVHKVLRPPE